VTEKFTLGYHFIAHGIFNDKLARILVFNSQFVFGSFKSLSFIFGYKRAGRDMFPAEMSCMETKT
jgi:hypothetical protein